MKKTSYCIHRIHKANRLSRLAPAGISLLLMTSLLAAPGCGGGSSPAIPGGVTAPVAGRGQVRFTIKWPESTPTRLIPQAAQSIKFRCLDADDEDELIMEQVVPKGQTVVTLDLPSVHVRIQAEACANADGAGQVLAKGGVTVKVQEAKVASEKLTLDSVITEVRVSRPEVDLPADTSSEVSAEALDATGAIVLTVPEKWEWIPDDAGAAANIVTFTPSGDRLGLSAKKDGTVAFTVKETETGKTARLTVTSHAPTPSPSPSPSPTPNPTPTPDTRPRLRAHVDPGPNGEYRAVEIWVIDSMVGVCDSTKDLDIPFPLTLEPGRGRTYIWMKDISNDPAQWYYFHASFSIEGIGGVSGNIQKNDYLVNLLFL